MPGGGLVAGGWWLMAVSWAHRPIKMMILPWDDH
jgi:hypothetical protein